MLIFSFPVCVADSQECVVALELGIAIPTQSNATDWSYTKRFVASVIEQLDIGWPRNGIQVGVVTYRGLSRRFYRATLCCSPVSLCLSVYTVGSRSMGSHRLSIEW